MNYDIERIKNEFEENLSLEYFELVAYSGYKIQTEEDARNILSKALQTRKLQNSLEEKRIELTKPHFDYKKDIDELVKTFKYKLNEIESNLHDKLHSWMKLESKLSEIEVEDGKIYYKENWVADFDSDNIEEIPKEYLMVNKKKLQESVNNGVRNIPGVLIYKTKLTQLRIKN